MLNPDNTFEVLVDQTVVNSGSLLSDMTPPVNPPAEIEDPDDQKPEDWDERPKIQDPSATKPEDWSVHRHQRDAGSCLFRHVFLFVCLNIQLGLRILTPY